jgi:hypothetical protein
MRYWTYYAAWLFLSYAMAEPRLLIGLVVLLLLHRVLPEPNAIFRALRRSRALRDQVELNPANVMAARDLAIVYLDVLRPRAALHLLEAALKRAPREPELLYLAGLALHRLNRHEEALPKLVEALERDPRVRFGLPYLVAGDALYALGRFDGALDAYERYGDSNSSDVRGYVRLAKAHHRLGDREATRAALDEAIRTWRLLPGHLRRKGLRAGVSALWGRVWMLRDPLTTAAACLLALGSVALLGAAAPGVVQFGRWLSQPLALGAGGCGQTLDVGHEGAVMDRGYRGPAARVAFAEVPRRERGDDCWTAVADPTLPSQAVFERFRRSGNGETWLTLLLHVLDKEDVLGGETSRAEMQFGVQYLSHYRGTKAWLGYDVEAGGAIFCTPDRALLARLRETYARAGEQPAYLAELLGELPESAFDD